MRWHINNPLEDENISVLFYQPHFARYRSLIKDLPRALPNGGELLQVY